MLYACQLAINSNNHLLILQDIIVSTALRRRHNGRDSVSNHQPRDCLLNRLFRHSSKKTSKSRVTGLCARNSPGTGEIPAPMASNAEMFPFNDVIIRQRVSAFYLEAVTNII